MCAAHLKVRCGGERSNQRESSRFRQGISREGVQTQRAKRSVQEIDVPLLPNSRPGVTWSELTIGGIVFSSWPCAFARSSNADFWELIGS